MRKSVRMFVRTKKIWYLCTRSPREETKESIEYKGSYQSGQMGLTVTQLAFAFGGSNPSLPTRYSDRLAEVAQSIEH